jgi:uncharacterized protein YqeY
MSLEQSLGADIVTAMKAKDQTKLTALRMLKTALTNKSIEKGRVLEGAEELAVVSMMVKQRRDSILRTRNRRRSPSSTPICPPRRRTTRLPRR